MYVYAYVCVCDRSGSSPHSAGRRQGDVDEGHSAAVDRDGAGLGSHRSVAWTDRCCACCVLGGSRSPAIFTSKDHHHLLLLVCVHNTNKESLLLLLLLTPLLSLLLLDTLILMRRGRGRRRVVSQELDLRSQDLLNHQLIATTVHTRGLTWANNTSDMIICKVRRVRTARVLLPTKKMASWAASVECGPRAGNGTAVTAGGHMHVAASFNRARALRAASEPKKYHTCRSRAEPSTAVKG